MAARTWDDEIAGLAHRAYDAYGDDAGWRNYRGEPMPRWRELPPKTRRHWCAAIAAIARPATFPPDDPERP